MLMRPQGDAKPFLRHRGHLRAELPCGVEAVRVRENGKEDIVVTGAEGLVGLAELGVLELHVWGARVEDIERPDLMVIDLDPGEGVAFAQIKQAALEVRQRLADAGLASFVKTTGSKGLHVAVPLTPHAGWEEVKAWTHRFSEAMARDNPALYLSKSALSERPGKIFVDYLRNAFTVTAVAPYSTRAEPADTIAAPLDWSELPAIAASAAFTVENFTARMRALGADPWAEMSAIRQTLPVTPAVCRSPSRKKPAVAAAPAAPAFVAPQLAALRAAPPEGPDWLHEIKYDGWRVLLRLEGGRVSVLSRRGHDYTERFGRIAGAARCLSAKTALIDGEAVVIGPDGRTTYDDLMEAFGGGSGKLISCFAFDLLHLDGRDLTSAPLRDRKERLRALLAGCEPELGLLYSDHLKGDGAALFEQACRIGAEGIVSKRLDAPYRSGRSELWVKAKCTLRQEFVIGGWLPSDAGLPIGSLLVGYFDEDGFAYAGKVATGFTRPAMALLRARLDEVRRPKPPFRKPPRYKTAIWADPELVCEVDYQQLSQGQLRHASFKGLRLDKDAASVGLEIPG